MSGRINTDSPTINEWVCDCGSTYLLLQYSGELWVDVDKDGTAHPRTLDDAHITSNIYCGRCREPIIVLQEHL